jgi:type IV pilus assembly protein PilB
MFEDQNSIIYEIFKECSLLTEDKVQELKETLRNSNKSLADVAVDFGLISRNRLLEAIANYLDYEFIASPPNSLPEEVLRQVPDNLANRYGIVPIQANFTSLKVFAQDPFNGQIIDDLTFVLKKDINIVVCDPEHIKKLLSFYYKQEESLDNILSEIDVDSLSDFLDENINDTEITEQANQTPIVRFVNLILTQAIHDKASDIHFEPFEDQFSIRFRIDGVLYEMAPPPKSLANPVISRIKVLADLNISERRVPQDGHIKITIAGRPVDLRVSTLPTKFGESVVLRVLDKSIVNLDLDMLNMPQDVIEDVRKLIVRPNGIFIVTGPTGCGKTTTLYSALREINKPEFKILTAEDPIEYEIEGIMQTAINPTIGFDFARALRSFLRQDPDKIMVGEIRDLETARTAVQASLTGHLVMSTLHTNDAAGAITRLIDMGLEPYLIAASLEAVLAQRLVRRICRSCRTTYQPTQKLIEDLELDKQAIAGKKFYYGSGCRQCNRTGYSGRLGLYEMMMIFDFLRELIITKTPTITIRQKAIEQGMRTLRQDGIKAMFNGTTTLQEVFKYT